MSRAYCLSCNELLDVTPSGTCPSGHPVGGDIQSPEPWVGFAAGRGTGDRAQMNGHASPALDVTALQEAPPRIPAVETFRESTAAPLTQDDDLARLLAEALEESDPDTAGPVAPAPPEEPAASWDDLATLAAELKFEAEPVADWEAPAVPDMTPEPEFAPELEAAPEPEVALEPEMAAAPEVAAAAPTPRADAMDLSALEEVLSAFEDPAPAPPVAESVADLPPPVFEAPPSPAVEFPPPTPPVADLPPPVADLPPPVVDLPPPAADPPPPAADPPPPAADPPPPVVPPGAPEPVGSEPLTAELPDDLDPEAIWADLEEPAPPPAVAPRIDPTNFTAKGSRIGEGQPRKRRWKR